MSCHTSVSNRLFVRGEDRKADINVTKEDDHMSAY